MPTPALLPQQFRFVHEPLRIADAALPLLGNRDCVEKLKKRLWNSLGGAFLITGFRGAGKSTVVHRAIDELTEWHDECTFLPILINIARPTTPSQLLFELVRRLFDELERRELLEELPVDVARRLLLAYRRTSFAMKETRSSSIEHAGGVSELALPLRNWIGIKVNWSRKSVRAAAAEATFLAYSEADVEYDFVHIVRLLSDTTGKYLAKPSPPSWWRRLLGLFSPKPPRQRPIRVVIVLDELDKLTVTDAGKAALDALLSGMKNLLVLPGAHFVLVGGADLYDRWLRDARRGNGLFESVFSWQLYVPCLWDAPEQLLSEYGFTGHPGVPATLGGYLEFKARGVPRRLVQEFNLSVTWADGRATLRNRPEDQELLSFYARINGDLKSFFLATAEVEIGTTPFDVDRRRLGAFYIIDWVLGSAGKPFTLEECVRLAASGDLDPLLQLSEARVEKLLEHLLAARILEEVLTNKAQQTIIGDAAAPAERKFRLVPDVLQSVLGLAGRSERERSQLVLTQSGAAPVLSAPTSHEPLLGERYRVLRQIGEGGMGSVYEAMDRVLGLQVAIKVLQPQLAANPVAVQRFRREAELLHSVSHPNIVRCYAAEPVGASLALVMEFVPGELLSDRLARLRLSDPEALAIALQLGEALAYLSDQGICRIDLKPDNVILHEERGAILIDLGIARFSDDRDRNLINTQSGVLIGTPQYMSPEQVAGDGRLDSRSDVFVFGLLLLELVSGHKAVEGDSVAQIVQKLLTGAFGVAELPVSPELRAVLDKALQVDREKRYPSPRALLDELRRTPEARAVEPKNLPPSALAHDPP